MGPLIMLLLLNTITAVLSQTNSSIPMNATLTYLGSAYSVNVYEVSYANSTGYVIIPQGVYQGDFAGLLRLGNSVYVGVYRGIVLRQSFIGYFIPTIVYEAVEIPTELSLSNYTYFEAVVQSGIPVMLRYLVFNTYVNGTMANTLSPVVVEESTTLTVWFSYGYDCGVYRVNATFLSPTQVVPVPVVINLGPPITYFVSNVTITNTSPRTELMLLEPGDIVYAETPITTANYTMYVCTKLGTPQPGGYGMLYAMEYIGPIDIPNDLIANVFRVKGTSTPLAVINYVFQKLTSNRFRLSASSVGPENLLTSGEGSVVDFVSLAMYVLRSYGIPTRVALGFYGSGSGNTYVFSSSASILWDESYVGNGWVMFTPIPFHGKPTVGIGYGVSSSSIILGLLLALPWIIGYVIYLVISHVKVR